VFLCEENSGLTLAENYYIMGTAPAEDENFCLRWNDYEKKYAETFRTLRNAIIYFKRNFKISLIFSL
jgi:hypothetical protein